MKLSPSKLNTFLSCGKLYEYKYIDMLSDPSGQAAVNGTAIHEALENLYAQPANWRTLAIALDCLTYVLHDWPKVTACFPEPDVCAERIWNLFDLEDPTTVNCRRTEMDLTLDWYDDVQLRGIIDRVDVEEDGSYTIVDYKSGKAPSDRYLPDKLRQMKFYAMMGLKAFGTPPKRVKLLFLGTPQEIVVDVSPSMLRGVEAKAKAAVEAIERGEFVTNPGDACRFCPAKDICPDVKKSLTPGTRARKMKPKTNNVKKEEV